MVFSNLLFIYLFLPVNLLCYALISDIKKKNACVLFFSLLFYAWTSPAYLLIMMALALINYWCARFIASGKSNKKRLFWLVIDLVITIGALGYFKYINLLCDVVNKVLGLVGKTGFDVLPEVLLPVGISFYSFQLISYVADVYRREVEVERKFSNVLLYTSLFHQCIAGPIVRYEDIRNSLKERKTDINSMNDGISRFCCGLAKKTLLSNSCASILAVLLPDSITSATNVTVVAAWAGGVLYMFQIYLDFSAYSDMAIGLGKMTGFTYRENFNYPYIADSITEFWRRWHISLSSFFRDYIYIPLGGNKKGIIRQLINMFIVWFLTGLWHGASYNFIVWGLYFFVFLAMEKLFLLKLFKLMKGCVGTFIKHIYTLFVVLISWIIFRFEDMDTIIMLIKSMFGANNNSFTNFETNTILMNNCIFIVICLIACTPLVKAMGRFMKRRAVNEGKGYIYVYNFLNVVLPVILMLASTIALIGNSYNPFIYFRF